MNAEDCYTITIGQPEGPDATITDAPPERNRLDRGVRVLLTRIRITREHCTITWDELRELAGAEGLYIDPRDYPSDAPSFNERYQSPIPGLLGLR